MMTEKVKIYDVEISRELFESVKNKIETVDPSRNYSKKHIIKQSIVLCDYLLEEKYKDHSKNLDRIKKDIQDLEEVLN